MTKVASPSTPGWDDDDDLPIGNDPNAIRSEYYDRIDLWRAGVPDDFISAKRRTGELRAVAKLARGSLLFDSRQARAVIGAYWDSQPGRAVADAWRNGLIKRR